MLKNFLITGGSGFIGSHFIDLLLSKNLNVINVDIKKDLLRKKKNRYKFIKGNICDYKFMNKIVTNKIDCIVNFAAQTHVDRSIDFPKDFVKNNILGTFNLLEVVRKKKIDPLFVQISTDEVFGSLDSKQKGFNEKSQITPNSPYSASKASADQLVRSYFKTFNLRTIITHSTNNFGERQHPEKLIPLSIMQIMKGKEIPVYGNGKNIRDWIYVKDNCYCIFEIIRKSKYGKSYLVGAKNEIQNIKIVKKIIKILKSKNKIKIYNKGYKFVADRKGHDFRYAVDNKKMIKLTNVKLTNFDTNLEKTVSHYYKFFKFYEKKLEEKWLKKKIKNYSK